MPQQTIVLALSKSEQTALEERIAAGAFEHRQVRYARFSVKGEGVVATLYDSGKLVVQGAEAEPFALRYVGRAPAAAAAKKDADVLVPAGSVVVGSDEAGKGDYFGPLVVCALRLPAEGRDDVRRSRVTDSKALSDDACLRMGPALEEAFEPAVRVLAPSDYNALHEKVRNLNPMLADLHAEAIRAVAQAGDVVLVDRFADERLVKDRLKGLKVTLIQVPRAERDPAVAAASVVARARFLTDLRALSDEFAVDLRKGAGPPTDAAAREFVRLHGFDALSSVAKVHFKNTAKIRH